MFEGLGLDALRLGFEGLGLGFEVLGLMFQVMKPGKQRRAGAIFEICAKCICS